MTMQLPGHRFHNARSARAVNWVLLHLAAGAIFGVIAYIGIELTRAEGRVAAVWIPNALAVAFLLRIRVPREEMFIATLFCANLAANILVGDMVIKAAALSACNSLEIAIALSLTRKWCGARPDMMNVEQLARFILAATIIAPMASASMAMLVLYEQGGALWPSWAQWAATDGLGMAIAAPSALIFHDAWRNRHLPTPRQMGEWAALTIAGTSITAGIFMQTEYPLLFMVPLVVLSHAFRLGALGTAFSVVKVAMIATFFTSLGSGPINLIQHSLSAKMIVLQAFLAASFLAGLPVAAILLGRERMIADLAYRKRQLALLADNITDAVLRYDLDGRCTYASPSASEVLGEPAQTIIGRMLDERAHPDTVDRIRQAEQKLRDGSELKVRFTFRRAKDDVAGNPVYIEADCALATHPDTGACEGIVISARDVTPRIQLELLLTRARRHAENAARAKSEFLANMSHEIRTPMNGVLGFAELLLQADLPAQQHRHAELIVQSGRSMMLLLNDILDLSKIEAGQIRIDHHAVELGEIMEDCAALHRATAEKKQLSLVCTYLQNAPMVMTDGLRLRQILLNLVGNAVKFTEAGQIEVALEMDDDQFIIRVCDTGIGISKDRLERIFEPFEQGDNETTRRYGGTGLGLSISRQLAELLGGLLEVESTPGQGTVFSLTLPLIVADEIHAPYRAPADAQPGMLTRQSHILLAEDHDINRLLVTEMLERCGQKVSIAHDGEEAIARVLEAHASGQPFDLVLMDIQMPGCDGYAATRMIRAEGVSHTDLPIVALTANAFAEDIAAARDAGMQAHLSKPLAFDDLVACLQRWLPTRIVEEDAAAGLRGEVPAGGPTGPARHAPTHTPELLNHWRQRRQEALAAVTQALRNGQLHGMAGDDLARLVHKLAGTAGMFGEEELGERAAAFERALRSQVPGEVRRKMAQDLLDAA